jgi:arsenite transporter
VTERWTERQSSGTALVERIGWLPVPLLAIVVFLIAASQVQAVLGALPVLGHVLGVFLAFLVAAALIGVALSKLLESGQREQGVLVCRGQILQVDDGRQVLGRGE